MIHEAPSLTNRFFPRINRLFVWFLLSEKADNKRQTMSRPRLIILYNSIKNLV